MIHWAWLFLAGGVGFVVGATVMYAVIYQLAKVAAKVEACLKGVTNGAIR